MDLPTILAILKEVPLESLVVLILMLAGVGGLYLAFGGKFKDKDGKLRRILHSKHTTPAMIVSLVLIGAGIAIFLKVLDRGMPPEQPEGGPITTPAPVPPEPTTPPPTEVPTIASPSPSVSPPTPYPSATPLGWIYDNFDDTCISIEKWFPRGHGAGAAEPTPIVRGSCFDFRPPDRIHHMLESNANLIIPSVGQADDGLISYWPRCQARAVQLVVSSYSYEGDTHGWVGLVVPHPQRGNAAIAVWISSRHVLGEVETRVITTRGWVGSQLSTTAQELLSQFQGDQEIVLGIAFDGEYAHVSVGNIESLEVPPIPAVGFQNYFSIAYAVTPNSELYARIAEIRVVPVTFTSWCTLPRTTPAPP
jgi:hypothetical protein